MPSKKHQRTKEAASELAAVCAMNAGRAFDRDVLRGSTGDLLIDKDSLRKVGRSGLTPQASSSSLPPPASANLFNASRGLAYLCDACDEETAVPVALQVSEKAPSIRVNGSETKAGNEMNMPDRP